MPDLSIERSSSPAFFSARDFASYPFARALPTSLSRNESERTQLSSAHFGSLRSAPRDRSKDTSRRPLQPTFDTSTHESSGTRARGEPRRLRPLATFVPRRRASNHLSVTRPRVKARLTSCLQLRPHRPLPRPKNFRRGGRRSSATPPCRGVFDRVPGWRSASDVPRRIPQPTDESRACVQDGRTGSRSVPRQRDRLLQPGTSSIDQVSLRADFRQPCLKGPATVAVGFATDRPASNALSLHCRSRLVKLDSNAVPTALRRRLPRATRCLSTSATDCDPRAQPQDRPNPANPTRGRPHMQLT